MALSENEARNLARWEHIRLALERLMWDSKTLRVTQESDWDPALQRLTGVLHPEDAARAYAFIALYMDVRGGSLQQLHGHACARIIEWLRKDGSYPPAELAAPGG